MAAGRCGVDYPSSAVTLHYGMYGPPGQATSAGWTSGRRQQGCRVGWANDGRTDSDGLDIGRIDGQTRARLDIGRRRRRAGSGQERAWARAEDRGGREQELGICAMCTLVRRPHLVNRSKFDHGNAIEIPQNWWRRCGADGQMVI